MTATCPESTPPRSSPLMTLYVKVAMAPARRFQAKSVSSSAARATSSRRRSRRLRSRSPSPEKTPSPSRRLAQAKRWHSSYHCSGMLWSSASKTLASSRHAALWRLCWPRRASWHSRSQKRLCRSHKLSAPGSPVSLEARRSTTKSATFSGKSHNPFPPFPPFVTPNS